MAKNMEKFPDIDVDSQLMKVREDAIFLTGKVECETDILLDTFWQSSAYRDGM